jgi:para-nitrobenzyl esterase
MIICDRNLPLVLARGENDPQGVRVFDYRFGKIQTVKPTDGNAPPFRRDTGYTNLLATAPSEGGFMAGNRRMGRCAQAVFSACLLIATIQAADRVKIQSGELDGLQEPGSGVRAFKGIPFAAPPVGPLRWKAPKPAAPWTSIRKADEFGSRCMQGNPFGDMTFRDKGISEDCLYLNVWTPAASAKERLPVMVWIYGGGFAAGGSSEPRQDGGNLAKKGVVVVSFNYRLGVFGFLSHPDLTRESDRNASGNYGLLDQVAALGWVRKNIGAFGGDAHKVTIFGESAGSFSVSALMASPLAQGLFQRAIGESGAFTGSTALPAKPRAETEQAGRKFAESLAARSVEELRAKPADELQQAALKLGAFSFAPNIDGYFLPEDVAAIYTSGKQSHIPLLAGWNADEASFEIAFAKEKPTAANFAKQAQNQLGARAETLLKLYPAVNDEEARRSAQDLAGDRFIAFSTWKWIELHLATGKSSVYRYQFDQAPPAPADAKPENPAAQMGAYHSAEIEFVFEALDSKQLPWRSEDRKVSDLMSSYWVNFAKTGDPNGPGLPRWPEYDTKSGWQVMHLSATPQAAPDAHRNRYLFLDEANAGKPAGQ